jgi:hypothetical protein
MDETASTDAGVLWRGAVGHGPDQREIADGLPPKSVAAVGRFVEAQNAFADGEDVAVEEGALLDLLAVDEESVAAAEIARHPEIVAEKELGVVAGDGAVAQGDVVVGRATDGEALVGEFESGLTSGVRQ